MKFLGNKHTKEQNHCPCKARQIDTALFSSFRRFTTRRQFLDPLDFTVMSHTLHNTLKTLLEARDFEDIDIYFKSYSDFRKKGTGHCFCFQLEQRMQ